MIRRKASKEGVAILCNFSGRKFMRLSPKENEEKGENGKMFP